MIFVSHSKCIYLFLVYKAYKEKVLKSSKLLDSDKLNLDSLDLSETFYYLNTITQERYCLAEWNVTSMSNGVWHSNFSKYQRQVIMLRNLSKWPPRLYVGLHISETIKYATHD